MITMNLNLLLTDAEAAGSTSASLVSMILMVVVWFVIIYFLMLRPQKKEQKKKAALVNSVEVGDSILTTSGFYGIVIDVTDEDVIVEFGNNKNCRIPMKKAAIEQVEKPDAE
jgi:preprotein translocase subunit YajC